MKKTVTLILFTIMLIALAVSIVFCVYCIVDINLVLNEIANDPSSSGIDYLGIGWAYGLVLFMLSIFGLILSMISTKILHQNKLRYISLASTFLFGLLIITSILIFYA